MTIRTSPVAGPQRIKQGKASLIGGIAVGVAVLVLWIAVAHELAADNVATLIVGALVAAGIATWIRVADL
jgi:lipopolysaccharide export LptBFGC system permease protein LptF